MLKSFLLSTLWSICILTLAFPSQLIAQEQTDVHQIDLGKIKKKNEDVVDLAITNTTDESIFLLNYQCERPMRFLANQPYIAPGQTAVYRIKVNPREEGEFEERLQLYFNHSETPFVFYLRGDVIEVPVNDLQKCPSFKDLPSKRELVRNQRRAQGNIQEFAITLGGEEAVEEIATIEEEQEDTIATAVAAVPAVIPAIVEDNTSEKTAPAPIVADSLLGEEYLPNNIIFLIDVSSSMEEEGRFDLLKISLYELLKPLRSIDYLSMISFDAEAELLLAPTSSIEKERIEERIRTLKSGGSTNAVKGIDLALKIAYESFIEGGNNEVYLVSDGEFYLGERNYRSRRKIEEAADKGIRISVLAVKSERASRSSLREIVSLGEGDLIRLERSGDKDKILEAVKENSLR